MKSIRTIALIVASTVVLHASGESFDSLVDRMIALNPGLRSEAYAYAAQRESLRSAAMLPDPEIEGGYMWSSGEPGNKTDITESQSMEWPGVYSAMRREARLQSKATNLSEQATIISARENARILLAEGVYLNKCHQVMVNRMECIDSLLDIATKGALRNEITLLDVEKLKLERLEVLARQTELNTQATQCISAIGAFIGSIENAKDIYNAIEDYPAEMLHPLAIYSDKLDETPEVEQSRILAEASRARSEAERRRSLPSLTAGYHFAREEGTPFHGFVAGLSIPVFSTRGKSEAARLESMAAEARAEQQAIEQRLSLESIHASAMQFKTQYESYHKVLTDSPTPRLLLRALEGGQISMMVYLIESASHTDAILRMLEIQYRYQQAMAQLARYNPGN